jgi:hypothetical protein
VNKLYSLCLDCHRSNCPEVITASCQYPVVIRAAMIAAITATCVGVASPPQSSRAHSQLQRTAVNNDPRIVPRILGVAEPITVPT